MKNILRLFLILLIPAALLAQEHTISYQIAVFDPLNPGSSFSVSGGDFQTGESFIIPAYTLPASLSDYQPLYDALVGSEFGIDSGALTENITIQVNIMQWDPNNPGAYIDPLNPDNTLFMFLGVAVIGENSGVTPIDDFYYLEAGKFGQIKIPLSAMGPLLSALGLATSDIGFGYYIGSLWTSGGLTWDTVSEPGWIILKLSHFSKFGGGKGGLVSVEDENSSLSPDKFELGQNYPNPFNPTTNIQYSIPSEGFVSMKVYNAIGSEVTTLVSEQKSAGIYNVNFDASELTSGVYFYSISFNGRIQTKKMLLIK